MAKRCDADKNLAVAVLGMEVRRVVVVVEDPDDDSVKAADSGMPAGRLRSRKHVLWSLSSKFQVEGVRTQVEVAWPFDLSMRSQLNPVEHAGLFPRREHAFAHQMGEVYLALRAILVAQPDSIACQGSNLNRANHSHDLSYSFRTVILSSHRWTDRRTRLTRWGVVCVVEFSPHVRR
jgi:hypothetical protein